MIGNVGKGTKKGCVKDDGQMEENLLEATEDGELTTMVLTGTKESLVLVVWAAARPAAPRAARMVEERILLA